MMRRFPDLLAALTREIERRVEEAVEAHFAAQQEGTE